MSYSQSESNKVLVRIGYSQGENNKEKNEVLVRTGDSQSFS